MDIGILGDGRMGRALGELLEGAGHDVAIASRTSGKAAFSESEVAEAITDRHVVVIALPHTAIEPNLDILRGLEPGVVVIDIANAVRVEDSRIRSALDRPHGRWLAELLPRVRVARAFTHVQDELLVSRARRQPGTWAIGVAGDDAEALSIASRLVEDAGYIPVVVGDLDHSEVLDPGGPLFPNMFLPGDLADAVSRSSER